MNIIEACHSPEVFGGLFKDHRTWRTWHIVLKCIFGLRLTKREQKIFNQYTSRAVSPRRQVRDCIIIAGRRSGKSFTASLIASYLAAFYDYSPYLSVGEVGYIFIVARDKMQSRIIKTYVSEIFKQSPVLRQFIKVDLKDELQLNNGITISIKTADFGSVRGYTILACIMEEIAFFPSEGAQPAEEILRAIEPGMGTIPSSMKICISTPYSKSGLLWDLYKRYYQKPGPDLFFWKSPSLTLNPTLNRGLIKRARKSDPFAARSEWEAEFRDDISGFISIDALEKCVVAGRYELPPNPAYSYYCFVDPSGGASDSFTLCISHWQDSKVVIDCLREVRPPFQPSQIVSEFSTVIQSYGLNTVRGDRYGAMWPVEAFQKHGIMFNHSELNKSQLYLGLLPLIMNQQIELLDNSQAIKQLSGLERSARSGGRDIVDHPPGGHDDLGNVVAGSALLSSKAELDWPMPPPSLGISREDADKEFIKSVQAGDPDALGIARKLDVQINTGEIVPRDVYDWLCPREGNNGD